MQAEVQRQLVADTPLVAHVEVELVGMQGPGLSQEHIAADGLGKA